MSFRYEGNDIAFQDLCPERYHGPRYAAETIARYLGNSGATCRVIDVAAGTGFVGVQVCINVSTITNFSNKLTLSEMMVMQSSFK